MAEKENSNALEAIEAYLDDADNQPLKKPLLEAFEWVSNRSMSVLMSALTGEKILTGDIAKFKKQMHLKSFQEAQSKLDVTKTKDANEWFLLDAIHKTRIDPGKTGSIAALQALKNIQDIEDREAEADPSEAILSGLLDWISSSPEFSAEQKNRIAGEVLRIQKSLAK